MVPIPPPAPPLPTEYEVPVRMRIFNQGVGCGSCYAIAAAGVMTDRINQLGLYGAGNSTFPQEGCEKCLPLGKTCRQVCEENPAAGDFGYCAHPELTHPDHCCACSPKGLGHKAVSPGYFVACNQMKKLWSPSDPQFGKLAEAWAAKRMGGCNGGFPVLMMEMAARRGAGTCDQVRPPFPLGVGLVL